MLGTVSLVIYISEGQGCSLCHCPLRCQGQSARLKECKTSEELIIIRIHVISGCLKSLLLY